MTEWKQATTTTTTTINFRQMSFTSTALREGALLRDIHFNPSSSSLFLPLACMIPTLSNLVSSSPSVSDCRRNTPFLGPCGKPRNDGRSLQLQRELSYLGWSHVGDGRRKRMFERPNVSACGIQRCFVTTYGYGASHADPDRIQVF